MIEITGDAAKIQSTIDKLEQIGRVDKKNADQFKRHHDDQQRAWSDTSTRTNELSNAFDSLGRKILAVLAVERVIAFGKAIVQTRAEFQRFEAQLTTALGSNSEAQRALTRIQKFAAETPFGVKELTEVFVKLANRGISPTNDQLRKMGDLAAALGKPVEDLNEAILDISNDKRWTELGIQVSKNGDKIIGKFRGMTVEAEHTTAGALKMVEAFGAMEGVAGGMERQMETLGGQMSNLNDNFEALLNNLGQMTQGVVMEAFAGMNEMLSQLNENLRLMNTADETLKKIGMETPGFWSQWAERNFGVGSGLTEMIEINAVLLDIEEKQKQIAAGKFEPFYVEKADELLKKLPQASKLTDDQRESVRKLYQEMVALDNRIKVQNELRKSGSLSDETYSKTMAIIINQQNVVKDRIKEVINEKKTETGTTIKSADELKKLAAQREKEIESLEALRRKLREVQLDEQEKLADDLKAEEKSEKIYSIRRKRIEKDFEDKKKDAAKIYKDEQRLAEALVLLEKIKNQELINLALQFAGEIEAIRQREAIEAIERSKRIADMEIQMMELNHDDEEDIYNKRIKTITDYYDEKIKIETDAFKKEELLKQKELALFQTTESFQDNQRRMAEAMEKEEERHILEMMRIQKKGAEEMLKKEIQFAKERLKILEDENQEGTLEYEKALNHKIELEEKLTNMQSENREANVREAIAALHEIAQATIKAYEAMIDAELDANRTRIDNQHEILETQRVLASQGLENTLAFEQKRQDELYKQELALKKKKERLKELEIFLNALAKFVEENPKTALPKALGLIAATQAAKAIFAEEGAIVGHHETPFTGQRHRSGRDRIAIVEEGEGIIPVSKMAELGLNSKEKFSSFLKTPITERAIPERPSRAEISMSGVISELQELKEVVKNKQELQVDWEGLDLRLSKIEKGLKTVTTVKRSTI